MNYKELQSEELEALQSIYDTDFKKLSNFSFIIYLNGIDEGSNDENYIASKEDLKST